MGLIGWAFGAVLALGLAAGVAFAEPPQFTPTGQFITPRAAPGAIFEPLNPHLAGDPSWTAGQASAVALSPDGGTLLVLTSGYNLYFGADGKPVPAMSQEYVFVFDVSGARPVQRQVIPVPNTFLGVAWDGSDQRFYVSGGVDDVRLRVRQERGRVSADPHVQARPRGGRRSRRQAGGRRAGGESGPAAVAGRERQQRLGER